MSLKFRLAFLYSLSVFIILLISAVSIFVLNESFRKEEFLKRLGLEAAESIQLFVSVPGPPSDIINDLNQNAANSLPKERIFIFDSAYHLLYSSTKTPAPAIPRVYFNRAKKLGFIFTQKGWESVLLYRNEKNKQLYVLASAYDVFGRRKSENLKVLLASSVFGGLLLSGFLAFFYVRQAMNPLEELKGQIEKIDEKNLKERIPVGDKDNEVSQIADKFNQMLDRLEQAFEQRKNFVQYASHELRTPLANMLSQTESALSKNLSGDDYRKILLSLQEDQQDMIDLTNSLLTLSRYEKISWVADWSLLRIDELIYETVEFIKKTSQESVVAVDFETVPENETELEIRGNESLIRSAVQNLSRNAVNYSADLNAKISIRPVKSGVILHFDNKGKQLTDEEQSRLFIPFFRGENSLNKKGFGLGLSIVQRIINLHKGSISYQPIQDNINRFTVYLPSNK
jgi:signal transduction histidine kinase